MGELLPLLLPSYGPGLTPTLLKEVGSQGRHSSSPIFFGLLIGAEGVLLASTLGTEKFQGSGAWREVLGVGRVSGLRQSGRCQGGHCWPRGAGLCPLCVGKLLKGFWAEEGLTCLLEKAYLDVWDELKSSNAGPRGIR